MAGWSVVHFRCSDSRGPLKDRGRERKKMPSCAGEPVVIQRTGRHGSRDSRNISSRMLLGFQTASFCHVIDLKEVEGWPGSEQQRLSEAFVKPVMD